MCVKHACVRVRASEDVVCKVWCRLVKKCGRSREKALLRFSRFCEKKLGGPKILNVSGQNDRLEIRPRPRGAETIRFRFMLNVQGAGSPQKKVERINPALIQHASCMQTFSHEEIQPFKLSRNTF